jgi:hypothetical protein
MQLSFTKPTPYNAHRSSLGNAGNKFRTHTAHSQRTLCCRLNSACVCFLQKKFFNILLKKNLKGKTSIRIMQKLHSLFGSTLYFDPSNYFIIFKLQRSQVYITRATWIYTYFGANEKLLKNLILEHLKMSLKPYFVGRGVVAYLTSLG